MAFGPLVVLVPAQTPCFRQLSKYFTAVFLLASKPTQLILSISIAYPSKFVKFERWVALDFIRFKLD
ncbi:MAG: hypothetical protein BVN35_20865 [Proteobacteria bacterium ST_bin11]|jgi:hypothetical protein|nr:MAG: hypothetical protein BVN35_20865 [Proteobacteria bacterium ST_bin11]